MYEYEYMKHVYALRVKDIAEKILTVIYANRQFGCVDKYVNFFFCILISYGGLKKKQNKSSKVSKKNCLLCYV